MLGIVNWSIISKENCNHRYSSYYFRLVTIWIFVYFVDCFIFEGKSHRVPLFSGELCFYFPCISIENLLNLWGALYRTVMGWRTDRSSRIPNATPRFPPHPSLWPGPAILARTPLWLSSSFAVRSEWFRRSSNFYSLCQKFNIRSPITIDLKIIKFERLFCISRSKLLSSWYVTHNSIRLKISGRCSLLWDDWQLFITGPFVVRAGRRQGGTGSYFPGSFPFIPSGWYLKLRAWNNIYIFFSSHL